MRSRRSVRMMGRAFPTSSPRHSVTSSLHHSSPAGFTAVEVAVVLVVVASILLIVTPGMIQWYWRQRFFQTVEQVGSALRLAQFSAISTGRWMAVVVYKDCPDSLQLRRLPGPVNVLACIARFRLAVGDCGFRSADWDNITGNYDTALPACTGDLTNPALCEYVQDFWLAPTAPRTDVFFGNAGFEVFVISPTGTIGRQTSAPASPWGDQCLEMMGPDVWRIETLPASALIDPNQPTLQMYFQFPMDDPRLFRGVCVSGGGRVGLTGAGLTPSDLTCS